MPLSFEILSQQNQHLLEDPVRHAAYVVKANLQAHALGKIKIPDVALSSGETFSLAQFQSSIKDQSGRGTCYAFAGCAALEASYKRQYGLDLLDLSEQYAFHINKASALVANYTTTTSPFENNTSWLGFQGSSDIIDKMARFAVPAEADCKYLTESDMAALKAAIPASGNMATQEQIDALEFNEGHIPTSARQVARYRVKSYAALPANPTVDQVKKVLKSGYEVVADIPQHCFLIIGFDDHNRKFQVKNSWGGTQYFDYSYDSPLLGARYITEVEPVGDPHKREYWLGSWHMDHDGWAGRLMIRRFTDFAHGDNEPTKLGDYYRDGKRYDVNGTVTPDGQTMDFHIADTTDRTEPGSTPGQHFRVSVFSSDPNKAAGWTMWAGTGYGVRLSRAPITHVSTDHFDQAQWIDTWSMNHDGSKGLLRIAQLSPLVARYELPDRTYDVTGALDTNHPHILHLRIPFDAENPQAFDLYHHTREQGLFSGTTTWNGHLFGVTGDHYVEPVYPPLSPPGPGVMAAFIYGVQPNGILRWYRHDGARHGTTEWQGPRSVGWGWNEFLSVFPGGGDVIYAITSEGRLLWYRHKGFNTGAGLSDPAAWAGWREVGHGWSDFKKVFSGGNGIIYAITQDGRLKWYRHHLVATGEGLETPGAWSGAVEAGIGWDGFTSVFSTGEGIIYAVSPDGTLNWYNHLGHREGLAMNAPGAWANPKVVGRGWDAFTTLFSRADGVIYGIEPDGTLKWYRHLAYKTGGSIDVAGSWEGRIDVGHGWQHLKNVFALLPRDSDPVR